MQFAPDGRLFVCEQGGRLRVIKNGVLLPTPFVTLTVNSSGERGLLGVAFDPAFAAESVRLRLLHGDDADRSQSHQPLHGERRRRGAGSEVVILDLDNLSSATNHNGGALAFGPDGKLYAAVGENANSANAQTLTQPARQDAPHQQRRHAFRPTIRSSARRPAGTARSGRSACATRSRSRSTRTGRRCSSTTSGRTRGRRSTTGSAGANYGWPDDRGADDRSAIRGTALRLHALGRRRVRDHRRRLLLAAERAASRPTTRATTSSPTSAAAGFAGSIPTPATPSRTSRRGIALTGRSEGDRRRRSVLPRARIGRDDWRRRIASTTAARRARASRRSRRAGPSRPGRRSTFSVTRVGRSASELPVAAQRRRTSRAPRRRTTRSRRSSRPTTARSSARSSRNDVGSVISTEAVLTVTANQAPTATIVQPASGTLYTGGTVITYSGTATDPEDGTLPASAFTWRVDFHHDTHTHPFIAPTSGRDQRVVHDSDDRRDGGQRLVSHLPDGARFRRPHAHDPARRPAAHGPADARHEPRRRSRCGWTDSRSPRR